MILALTLSCCHVGPAPSPKHQLLHMRPHSLVTGGIEIPWHNKHSSGPLVNEHRSADYLRKPVSLLMRLDVDVSVTNSR